MNTSPRLGTSLTQRQTLAPRQSQALRLLAMPTLDLEQMLEAALEENAMLERLEPDGEEQADGGTDATGTADDESDWDYNDWSEGRPGGEGLDQDRLEALPEANLRQHLIDQLALERFSSRDYLIALALVDTLDENGYLDEELSAIAGELSSLDPIPDIIEIEAVLRRVQRLDPVGVAARSAAECLLLQLDALPRQDMPALETARQLLQTHFDRLARSDLATLARLAGSAPETTQAALALIQSLNPRPGAEFSSKAAEYLIPELRARKTPEGWRVELYPGSRPRIGVNETYASWLSSHRREDNTRLLAAQLEEARWLIRSLAQRDDTLIRVARILVERQSAFLEQGPLHLAPLTLREVAEALEMHESTISRAVQGKAMSTPRGVILLRHLFSNSVSNEHGEGLSATAVRERLRYLLTHEDPTSPLSDAALADALARDNIPIARRTVAKYREAMGFPSTRERKRPAHSTGIKKE